MYQLFLFTSLFMIQRRAKSPVIGLRPLIGCQNVEGAGSETSQILLTNVHTPHTHVGMFITVSRSVA